MSWFSPATDAALGALGATAAGASVVLGRRLVTGARTQAQDDHQPINYGSWGCRMPPDSNGDGIRVLIICAPSRTIPHARFDPGAAIRFAKRHFGQDFPKPASSSGSNGVHFEGTPEIFGGDYLWINASGRVDLAMTVPTSRTAEERVTLSVVDLLQPVARVAVALRDPDYWQVFGSKKAPRHPRFDWHIGTSIDIHDRDTGYRVAWNELCFPGRIPSHESEQRPFCPAGGFAANELKSRRSDAPIQELLRPLLSSFLTENGYHDVEGPIDDVFDDWQSR